MSARDDADTARLRADGLRIAAQRYGLTFNPIGKGNYRARCPKHMGPNPTLEWSDVYLCFTCWGCCRGSDGKEWRGSIFDLIQLVEGGDFNSIKAELLGREPGGSHPLARTHGFENLDAVIPTAGEVTANSPCGITTAGRVRSTVWSPKPETTVGELFTLLTANTRLTEVESTDLATGEIHFAGPPTMAEFAAMEKNYPREAGGKIACKTDERPLYVEFWKDRSIFVMSVANDGRVGPRKNERFTEVTGLKLDYDLDLDAAWAERVLTGREPTLAGVAYAAHTTVSSRPDAMKMHVVFPAGCKVPADLVPDATAELIRRFGQPADNTCTEHARGFYFPHYCADAPHRAYSQLGNAVNIFALATAHRTRHESPAGGEGSPLRADHVGGDESSADTTRTLVPRDLFVYFTEANAYVYLPTGAQWTAAGVNAVAPGESRTGTNGDAVYITPSRIIKETSSVTSRTSDPDYPQIIEGMNFCEGGLVQSPGARALNTYRPAMPPPGDPALAGPFIEHCRRVYNKPGDAEQFLDYMAHRAQRPGEKPRFALLIAGPQGTGKDTTIDMCVPAIGSWNVASISPAEFEGSFNEFQAKTLVRINEASNQADMSKWALNEATKVLIAGAPDVTTINPKYGKKYTVRMHCGVVVTTNNLATGFYIPPDDRRYDVIDTATLDEMGLADAETRRTYFENLWNWFNFGGGEGHVAAFLLQRDITGFSASGGQRKTAAHREVVMIGLAQDEWFEEFLDHYGNPNVFLGRWATDHAAKQHPGKDYGSRLGSAARRAGFVVYRNPKSATGRWHVGAGGLATVYARGEQTVGFHPPTDSWLLRPVVMSAITPDHTLLKDVSSSEGRRRESVAERECVERVIGSDRPIGIASLVLVHADEGVEV